MSGSVVLDSVSRRSQPQNIDSKCDDGTFSATAQSDLMRGEMTVSRSESSNDNFESSASHT